MNKEEVLIRISEILDERMIETIKLFPSVEEHHSETNILKNRVSEYVKLKAHLEDLLK